MPRRIRHTKQAVTATALIGAGAAVIGAVAAAPATLVMWKLLLLGGAGVAVVSNRAGEAMMRRRIEKLSSGQLELVEVGARPEGELIVVRGTIEADATISGVLLERPVVYRRLELAIGRGWVHEAAVNFSIVDDAGEMLFVEAGGRGGWFHRASRLLTRESDLPARMSPIR